MSLLISQLCGHYGHMGILGAFDQSLSHVTMLYPPEVVLSYVINDIPVKRDCDVFASLALLF
jgi:hypothetical protein